MLGNYRSERGQALVLIVLGIIGLVGITALSIDGGNAYFDRRRAQNAADTAAMAAGLAKVRQLPSVSPADAWKQAGFDRAYSNGFEQSSVVVNQCDETGVTCALPSGVVLSQFVQVKITSTVDTWFAPVIGINQITNRVEAVAKAVKPEPTLWYNGAALASIMPGCKTPGWPNDPFTVGGGANVTVNGISNVFVNSNCKDDAYTQGGSSSLTSQSGTCVVGGVNYTDTTPPPNHNCTQLSSQQYLYPKIEDCPMEGSITRVGNEWVATAGRFDGVFPGVSPAGKLTLGKGIYCFQDGVDLHGSWYVTTDINGNQAYDNFEGVLFYVQHGGVTINGQVQLAPLHAITCHACDLDEDLVGYLIYLPPENNSSISIEGGSNSNFVGTILAPASLITLSGGSAGDSLNLQCQIIGYSIKLTGNGTLNITYDKSVNATTWTNPELLPYK
jgi:hypothetical protein